MIQRIQSVLLLLAAVFMLLLLAVPLVEIESVSTGIFADKIFDLNDSMVLMVLAILAGAGALLNIFLFKNRPLQRNICFLIVALVLAFIGVSIWELTSSEIGLKVGAGLFFPFSAIMFTFLAARGIKKDETLVRSSDRLR